MLYYTIGQWRVFVFMVLAGAAAGAWYGLMRRTGRLMAAGPWLNALLDLFTALGVWTLITAGLLVANYGEARAYALLGAALGFVVWRLTVERLLTRLAHWVGVGAKKTAEKIGSTKLVRKIFR